jgi:hypothetical protein
MRSFVGLRAVVMIFYSPFEDTDSGFRFVDETILTRHAET